MNTFRYTMPKGSLKLTCLLLLLLAMGQARGQLIWQGPMVVGGSTSTYGESLEIRANAVITMDTRFTVLITGPYLKIEPGARIIVTDENGNVLGPDEGKARFIMRPEVPGMQTIEGGYSTAGQLSLMHLQIDNPAGVSLVNSGLRITDTLSLLQGSLLLGDQNLALSPLANFSGYNNTQHIVTNGAGYIVKEGLANNVAFTFPAGRAAGDYTPATLTNRGGAANDYSVRVMDYAASAPDEYAGAGIDRSWHIHATNATLANVMLSHNTVTNGAAFSELTAFVTVQTSVNKWLQGPPVNTTGNPVNHGVSGGVSTQSRDLTLAASASDAGSWISVSSDAQRSLPITLVNFTARENNGRSLLEWGTLSESNSSHFIVQHSSSGGSGWSNIGKVGAAGQSNNRLNYQYTHVNPASGVNYYRLQLVDKDGSMEYSPVRSVNFKATGDVLLLPNPAGSGNGNHVKVVLPASLSQTARVQVYSSAGQLMLSRTAGGLQVVELDVANLAQGIYQVVVTDQGQVLHRKPLVKQ